MSASSLSVLGIDAAWTPRQPSGVALVVSNGSRWRLAAVASSYAAFLAECPSSLVHTPRPASLLARCEALTGAQATLVAADIPLSRLPITARRTSDNAVSKAYGALYASTHTPSATRPGPISDELRTGFEAAGYPLRTTGPVVDGLIEVYPHPALIELADAPIRLPYKAAKTRKYWPDLDPRERRQRLLAEWAGIVRLLGATIDGVADRLILPIPTASLATMKAFEDALDAIVCAWVGICVLENRAAAFGDEDSAIWVPALPRQ